MDDDGLVALLRAMVLQSLRDAHSSNLALASSATEFLTSTTGRIIRTAVLTDDEFIKLARKVESDGRRNRWQKEADDAAA